MAAPSERLMAAAHYVISKTPPSDLGKVKLFKVLWYSDIEHYRKCGRSITGLAYYRRMPKGPVPEGIYPAIRKLKEAGKITQHKTIVYSHERHEFVSHQTPETSFFDDTELKTLDEFIDIISKWRAEAISEETHKDALWRELANGERMSINAGAIIPRKPTPKELEWAESQPDN